MSQAEVLFAQAQQAVAELPEACQDCPATRVSVSEAVMASWGAGKGASPEFDRRMQEYVNQVKGCGAVVCEGGKAVSIEF